MSKIVSNRTAGRLEVTDGEVYVTVRYAAEYLCLGFRKITNLARDEWPSVQIGKAWLIPFEAIARFPRGTDIATSRPLSGRGNYNFRPQEMLVTRAGVLTTFGHICRTYNINPAMMSLYCRMGLAGQRIGNDTYIYEDEWEDFVRAEWARPRLKRPRCLPKPEGTLLGPIIPSPFIGVDKFEKAMCLFKGWTEAYAQCLEDGEPPTIVSARTKEVALKYNVPMVIEKRKPKIPAKTKIKHIDKH